MSRVAGKVIFFNNVKGFGFIRQASGPDLFCHFSAIEGEGWKHLRECDDVNFEIATDDQGRLFAAKVRKDP